MPTFTPPENPNRVPPIAADSTREQVALYRHFGSRGAGKSVLKIAGSYQTIETPTTTQTAAATEVYLGGHVYEVTTAVGQALAAAGYTVEGLDGSNLLLEQGGSLLLEQGGALQLEGI